MAHKSALDGQILNIIQNNSVYEQSEIQNLLEKKGYIIPQATLSRRLKKLNIFKLSGQYKTLEPFRGNLPFIRDVKISSFGLIVLLTDPGQANSIAYALDQKYILPTSERYRGSGILGTIAGDDTILVIIESKAALTSALDCLCSDFPYLNRPDIPPE